MTAVNGFIRSVDERQMEESLKVEQNLYFSTKLDTLNNNAPKVLNFMYRDEKQTLKDETETQQDVLVDLKNHKEDMVYYTAMEKRQR